MARHINNGHRKLIKSIYRKVAEHYTTTTSEAPPIEDLVPTKRSMNQPGPLQYRIYKRLRNRALTHHTKTSLPDLETEDQINTLDAFEKEYQDFIAKLKASKETKLSETDEEIIESQPIEEIDESSSKRKRRRIRKTDSDNDENNLTSKKRTRKTKQDIEE